VATEEQADRMLREQQILAMKTNPAEALAQARRHKQDELGRCDWCRSTKMDCQIGPLAYAAVRRLVAEEMLPPESLSGLSLPGRSGP
jgi:hypothetical protein